MHGSGDETMVHIIIVNAGELMGLFIIFPYLCPSNHND